MFEKYHLVHFEITNSLTENFNGRIYTDLNGEEKIPGNQIKWADVANTSNGTQYSSYSLTGNFDMLLPTVFTENRTEELYLQGFIVMNNTKPSFMKRSNYHSLLLSYTYSGEGFLIYKDKTYTLSGGHAFFIDCREPHEYCSTANHWEHVDIHIWGDTATSLYQHFNNQNIVTVSYPTVAFNELVKRLLDASITFSDHRTLFVGNALSNMICTLLEHAEEEGYSSIPDSYKYLIHYMECNYMNALTLDELSAFMNVSKYYFSHEFKKHTGFSPNDYLIELRIKHACILLNNSNLSIEQIAHDVGIDNMSNFIYQFKKRTGMTPSAFRKNR